MNKFYEEPVLEVNRFSVEDVITTSNTGTETGPILDEDELPPGGGL